MEEHWLFAPSNRQNTHAGWIRLEGQLVLTLPGDNDVASSFVMSLEVVSAAVMVSSGLISPVARFHSMPVVVSLKNTMKVHSR